jgi:hypothetical protein
VLPSLPRMAHASLSPRPSGATGASTAALDRRRRPHAGTPQSPPPPPSSPSTAIPGDTSPSSPCQASSSSSARAHTATPVTPCRSSRRRPLRHPMCVGCGDRSGVRPQCQRHGPHRLLRSPGWASRPRPRVESRPDTVHHISGFSISFTFPEIRVNF